jgi:predicted exporter
MASALRGAPGIGVVANGETEGMARDGAYLWENRYLLSDGAFGAEALHAALLTALRRLGSEFGVAVRRTLPADPTGAMQGLLDQLAGTARPYQREGVWFARDDSRALLLVQTTAAGFDIDGQQAALARIDAAFAKAGAGLRMQQSGPPVFAVRTRARMQGDAERLSLLATGLVAALLLLAYRSPVVLVLALLPVASGALAGIAATGAGFGFIHGITLAFGVTLIGEAVDYAIYLFGQTGPRLWATLRLGMLTSAVGFAAMLLSGFTGFVQLGLLTIVGLGTALLVTRFVLPALLPRGFAPRGAAVFARPLLGLQHWRRTARTVAFAVVAAALLVLATHRGGWWEEELLSMSPLSPAEAALDRELRAETGAPDVRHLLLVPGADRDQALAASERVAARLPALVAAGVLAGFDAPGRWLPSQATQRARQAALPEGDRLAADLALALQGTPFRPDGFAPFLADVAAARARAPLTRADLDGTSLALRLDSLLVPGAEGWVALLSLQGVADAPAVAKAVAGFGEPGLVFVDLKAESDHLLSAYLAEALTLSAAGSLAIVVLLAVVLRRPRRIAGVLLPLAGAVICTAALLLAVQARLSIFNLFGLLLIVAVGSNYCLFFSRGERDPAVRTRLLAALVLANLCTVIGFGILSFSAIPVLHGIGSTVAVGTLLSLVFAALAEPDHAG